MKKHFICLLFVAVFACLQGTAQQRISKKDIDQLGQNLKAAPLLLDGDEDFKTLPDASKWSSESAVVLCQKTSFTFDKKGASAGKIVGRNIWGILFAVPTLGTSLLYANMANGETKMLVEENERRKILLKDKFAVDQYSVLYFRLSSESDAFMARVIKKDGTVQAVDLSEAIRVEDIKSVPSTFRSYTEARYTTSYRPDFFKIAVPDLEEGDILEYEFRHLNTQHHYNNPSYKEFEPVYYLCNREMPVARQVIEVVTEDDHYHIGYKSLKGAPQFEQTTQGGKKVFRWTDASRDKMVDARYVNEYMELPSIKFQVVYARKSGTSFLLFGDQNDSKQEVSAEALGEKAKLFWFNPAKLQLSSDYTQGLDAGIGSSVQSIYKTLKKKNVTDGSDDDFVRKAYYYIRAQTLYQNWSDYAFARVFSGLLAQRKLEHEIVVSAPNDRTQIGQITFSQELAWAVKYKNKYYCNPGEHLNPEELPIALSGNAAIRFNATNEKAAPAMDTFPLGDTLNNVENTQIKASLQEGLVSMQVDKNVEVKGLFKEDRIDEVLAFTPFMENDYRNYDGVSMWEGMSDKSQEKARADFDTQKKEWKEQKPKMMEALAESEYGYQVDKYNSFRMVQDGRSYRKRDLKYSESFSLADVTSKAGEDIILPLPMLVGGQSKIKKEELQRSAPIDVRYLRTLIWNISFALPAGYTVKGLESLNKTLSNSCGSFTSTARLENNLLILNVKKVYGNRYFEVSKWTEMVALLEASYSFSQAKVILKKG